MIHQLTGTLLSFSERPPHGPHVVLDVHGVGYLIHTTPTTFALLPATGQPTTLYTHTVVAETVLDVVGFATPQERDIFTLLLQASGVGVKVALAMLTQLTVTDILTAIVSEQHTLLTAAKGVGPKLAKKVVLELREKMTTFRDNRPDMGALGTDTDGQPLPQTQAVEEAQAVLLSLGYQPAETHQALTQAAQAQTTEATSETLLQTALHYLATTV